MSIVIFNQPIGFVTVRKVVSVFELLSILAVFKLTVMLMDFNGPLNVFDELRGINQNFINFDCFFCLSTTVALPFALIHWHDFFVYWFGIAGGATLLNVIYERYQ